MEVVNDTIGASFLIFNFKVKLLQVHGPILMVVILKFSSCLHELHRTLIYMDVYILPYNVILPLVVGLYNVLHLFFIGGELTNDIRDCLTMIGH